jgi:hypothetical protein
MEYLTPEPTICPTCNTSPKKGTNDVIRCECPDKEWHSPGPVRASAEAVTLLKQKGFDLAGCGWYYYGSDSTLITLFSDGTWLLEYKETTIKNLKEYLLSLPDRPSPTVTKVT